MLDHPRSTRVLFGLSALFYAVMLTFFLVPSHLIDQAVDVTTAASRLVHAGLFFWFTLVAYLGYFHWSHAASQRQHHIARLKFVVVLLILTLATELLQSFFGRHFEWLDIVADLMGCGMAILMARSFMHPAHWLHQLFAEEGESIVFLSAIVGMVFTILAGTCVLGEPLMANVRQPILIYAVWLMGQTLYGVCVARLLQVVFCTRERLLVLFFSVISILKSAFVLALVMFFLSAHTMDPGWFGMVVLFGCVGSALAVKFGMTGEPPSQVRVHVANVHTFQALRDFLVVSLVALAVQCFVFFSAGLITGFEIVAVDVVACLAGALLARAVHYEWTCRVVPARWMVSVSLGAAEWMILTLPALIALSWRIRIFEAGVVHVWGATGVGLILYWGGYRLMKHTVYRRAHKKCG